MSVRETPKGSDENLTASSDSFWEVGNYRRTVKRIDDGAKLCDEFMKLIAERAEIEAKYSSKLKNWAKKWEEAIKLGPEYNSMEAAMKGAINEANSRSNVHTKCRDDLMNEVHELVKKWKTDNYHKSLFQWKETKEAEEGFSKAQKPWAKFLMKVMRAKKAYHAAAKAKDQADKTVTDANKDSNFPPDKLRKLEDLAEKKREEMEKTKQKYERRIDEITHDHNDTYAEGMARQFEKCQEFEEKRLEFMKQALMKYHQSLDISEVIPFKDIFIQMSTTFQLANSQQDLDWWSRNHGTAMPHNWPAFEDQSSQKSQRKSITSQMLNLLIVNRPKDFASELVSTYTGLKSDSSSSLVSSPSQSFVNRLDNVGIYHVEESSEDVLDIVEVSHCGISEFKTFGRRTSSTSMSCSHAERPSSLGSEDEKESRDPLIDIVDLSYSSIPEFKTFGCKTNERVVNLEQEFDPNQVTQKPEKLQYVANSNQVPLTGYRETSHDGRPPSPPPSYTGAYMEDNNAVPQYSTTAEAQYNTPKPLYNSDPQYDHPFSHGDNLDVDPPDDEWDSEPPPLPMDIGVPVRALYGYEKVEEDELTFQAGDILTKLSEVDDQGWCLGRFEGREGLIPADYVEAV